MTASAPTFRLVVKTAERGPVGWTVLLFDVLARDRARAMLEYKARLYGREFHRIGRFEPTTQRCSACGVKDGPKPLHVREWQCGACGVWLDRDVNAAVNVAKAAGLAVTACGAQVRPGSALAQRGEAGTHPTSRRTAA
jgi:putative transposase